MHSDKNTEKYKQHWEKAEEAFICPLSFELMHDPVTIQNGDVKHLERSSANSHFDRQRALGYPYTNPFTNVQLGTRPELITDEELKRKIAFFSKAKALLEAEKYTVLSAEQVGLIEFTFDEIKAQIDATHDVVLLRDDWFYLDNENRMMVPLFKESEILVELHCDEITSNPQPEISPSLWLNFTDFLCDNQEILLGLLLGTTLLLGMGALAVGTCGMSTILPVAAATVLVTAIGIDGIIAFLSVGAVVTGISGLIGAGWIGYSIFSHCTKTPEEPEIVRPAQEVI